MQEIIAQITPTERDLEAQLQRVIAERGEIKAELEEVYDSLDDAKNMLGMTEIGLQRTVEDYEQECSLFEQGINDLVARCHGEERRTQSIVFGYSRDNATLERDRFGLLRLLEKVASGYQQGEDGSYWLRLDEETFAAVQATIAAYKTDRGQR